MSNELELAAGDSAGAFLRRVPPAQAHAIGMPCANCATPLQGPWCHACGQSGEDFHRSIVRLIGEVVEGLLHADGRLWRTLPDLLLRPGRLTRAYLEGHRAPQIPPLRLFLVVLLAIFLVGGLTGEAAKLVRSHSTAAHGGGKVAEEADITRTLNQMPPDQKAKVKESLGQVKVYLGSKPNEAATEWLRQRVLGALADPERYFLVIESWSERFAFLMLPVSALLLSVLFVFNRQFYMFDHTIFSLHSLSAMGVMIITAMVLSVAIGDSAFLLLWAAPVHLFRHLRGVYRTSIVGTLIRMFLLFNGSLIAAAILFLGLLAVGLNGMGG